MKRTQYFVSKINGKFDLTFLWRSVTKKVTCFFKPDGWNPSVCSHDELCRDNIVFQISRDEARKLFPAAFHQPFTK